MVRAMKAALASSRGFNHGRITFAKRIRELGLPLTFFLLPLLPRPNFGIVVPEVGLKLEGDKEVGGRGDGRHRIPSLSSSLRQL
ncbi:unnamed protein product [Linum trigynum]|uniref:Uncharacterized protein n=1 Tax=Linum trigynum TaxID=586398 RepID=A0AAV2CWP1_9ROSI